MRSGKPVAATTTTPAPTPRWAGQWGSIATDNKLGKLGDFMHGINKESAESLAMLACKINGGTQCKIFISFHNECGAVTIGTGKIYGNSAETVM